MTKEYGISVSDGLNWNNRDDKIINIPEDKAENSFEKGVICFFAPSRFSKPVWLGDTYFNSSDQERYSIRTHFNGILRNPIESVCETHKTLQWILDVLVDARPDIEKNPDGNGYLIVHPELNLISLLKISKDNIEKVFSTILGEDIKLWMDNRMKGVRG